MVLDEQVTTRPGRVAAARQGWHKLRWGARAVGVVPALGGALRLARIRRGDPRWSAVTLRSGAVLGFEVPSQVPTALVVFRDLIDPEFAFLAAVARPDWTVVDVGAAIGQFSVFAGRLPVAAVHAYEPSGANRSSMARNLDRNALSGRVEIHAVALSDHTGEAAFETAGNTYLSRLDRHPATSGAHEVVAVRTLTDEVQRLGLERISVLKVNVAGYEPEVLAGAAPLLAAGAVDILVLLIGTRSIPWYARCEEWGYDFYFFHPEHRVLHRIRSLDETSLQRPPWPARHVIGIRRDVVRAASWPGVRVV